jgi:hypothetical protein
MQNDAEVARQINKVLNTKEHNIFGAPVFRVAYADDQYEMRAGTYNEFKGNLFVRTIYGVKKTPKYPQLKGIWILEMWHEPNMLHSEEIKDHNGYECLYAFRDRNFNPLPLNLKVVEIILKAKREYISPMLRKSLSYQREEDKDKASYNYIYDAIDPRTPVEASLHAGDGLSMYIKDTENAKTTQDVSNPCSKSGK